MLPDIQRAQESRGIEIDNVGVANVRFPFSLPRRDGTECNTVANVSMGVRLDLANRGTHMSRFMTAINDQEYKLTSSSLKLLLAKVLRLLEAKNSFIDVRFPIFLERQAPITRLSGLTEFYCYFKAMMSTNGTYDEHIGVSTNVTVCCPCSKEISAYGAHSQRCEVVIQIRPSSAATFWFEDLIDIAERNASCQLYPILKRVDEKNVTEHSFENPKFVEDVVRDVASELLESLNAKKVSWFHVSSTSQESIHNHDAYARIERGIRGPL